MLDSRSLGGNATGRGAESRWSMPAISPEQRCCRAKARTEGRRCSLRPLLLRPEPRVREAVGRGPPFGSLSNDQLSPEDNLFVSHHAQQSSESILGFAATRGQAQRCYCCSSSGPFGALSRGSAIGRRGRQVHRSAAIVAPSSAPGT